MTLPLRERPPLELNQLWLVETAGSEEVVYRTPGAEAVQLLRWGALHLGNKSLEEKAAPLRPLFDAVAGNDGHLPADKIYSSEIEITTAQMERFSATNDTALAMSCRGLLVAIIDRRTRSYDNDIRKLNDSIADLRDEGRNLYLGYGRSSERQFYVAQLAKLTLDNIAQDGRRRPIAIVRGRNGKLGQKPDGVNTRLELFEGNL